MNVELNIPPQEGEMLRHVSYEIAVLGRVIEEVGLLMLLLILLI